MSQFSNGNQACGACDTAARCDRCGVPRSDLGHQRSEWAEVIGRARPGVSEFWRTALMGGAFDARSDAERAELEGSVMMQAMDARRRAVSYCSTLTGQCFGAEPGGMTSAHRSAGYVVEGAVNHEDSVRDAISASSGIIPGGAANGGGGGGGGGGGSPGPTADAICCPVKFCYPETLGLFVFPVAAGAADFVGLKFTTRAVYENGANARGYYGLVGFGAADAPKRQDPTLAPKPSSGGTPASPTTSVPDSRCWCPCCTFNQELEKHASGTFFQGSGAALLSGDLNHPMEPDAFWWNDALNLKQRFEPGSSAPTEDPGWYKVGAGARPPVAKAHPKNPAVKENYSADECQYDFTDYPFHVVVAGTEFSITWKFKGQVLDICRQPPEIKREKVFEVTIARGPAGLTTSVTLHQDKPKKQGLQTVAVGTDPTNLPVPPADRLC